MSAWQAQDGLVLLRRHVAGDVLLFCGGGGGGGVVMGWLVFHQHRPGGYRVETEGPLREDVVAGPTQVGPAQDGCVQVCPAQVGVTQVGVVQEGVD